MMGLLSRGPLPRVLAGLSAWEVAALYPNF